MSNAKTIEPYAKLVHKAAVGGGPDKFLDEIARSSFIRGANSVKAKLPLYNGVSFLAGGAVMGIYIWGKGKLEDYFEEQDRELYARMRAAAKEIKEMKANKSETDSVTNAANNDLNSKALDI